MDWKSNCAITASDAASELARMLDKYDWFYDVVIENRSIVVYAHTMDKEVSDLIPDVMYGHQVKIGFASFLTCGEKYAKPSVVFGTEE